MYGLHGKLIAKAGQRDALVAVLTKQLADLSPGRALDVGCGEGADAIHLAEQGWQVTALDVAATSMRRSHVDEALAELGERERQVLSLRYGLDGDEPHTLDEVGRMFDITRERVRQIEGQSLRRLRLLPQSQPLRDAS